MPDPEDLHRKLTAIPKKDAKTIQYVNSGNNRLEASLKRQHNKVEHKVATEPRTLE